MTDPKTNKSPTMAADMTLRDYFAGQALTGIMASSTANTVPLPKHIDPATVMAVMAYQTADAMLAAREGKANE